MDIPIPPRRGQNLELRTFRFAREVVRLCRNLEKCFTLRRVAWQLLRSATSIGANYTESQAASSRRDFAMRQKFALREAREAFYWLRLIAASFPEHEQSIRPLEQEAHELVCIFTASVKRLTQDRSP